MTAAAGLRSMLEARSVAVVGASERSGSFGERMVIEIMRSPSRPVVHLVNPRYKSIGGMPCLPSLEAIDKPVDLVMLGVPDTALEAELQLAAGRGDRSAVVHGSAAGDDLRRRLSAIAAGAGMQLCGGGCMGFVNNVAGLRALGYIEPFPLPTGPVALVTHSGSAFSALLRTRRGLGFTLAVSSGQELVTPAASYVEYSLALEGTKVVALLLEAMRAPDALRASLAAAAAGGVPVVALTVGASAAGRAMVAAHSGALAGEDGAWEALFSAYGVTRVADLDEMVDTLELFSNPRWRAPAAGGGSAAIATVHDSGAERALACDIATAVGVPFAAIGDKTRRRLAEVLDPGLEPDNPLDLWGTGADTTELFTAALTALADDENVSALALCVDLVHELDGDTAYVEAALAAHRSTALPLAVLTNIHSSLDHEAAARLRCAGIPVLEGTRNGLLAIKHHLEKSSGLGRSPSRELIEATLSPGRARSWAARLTGTVYATSLAFELLADYGVETVASSACASLPEAMAAAARIGYPVALKTEAAGVAHKTEVDGVRLAIGSPSELAAAYADIERRLGPLTRLMAMSAPGVELSLGIARDPALGPLVVVGAGGILVEAIGDRAVGLPPLDATAAAAMLGRLRCRKLLDGVRGQPAADLDAVVRAIVSLSQMALELGEYIEALDINPLSCRPAAEGAVALDVLLIPRPTPLQP